MQTKHIIFSLFLLLLIASAWRFEEYYVRENFYVTSELECDSSTSHCFVQICDVENTEGCNVTPYQRVKMDATGAPACLYDQSCESFNCEDTDVTCEIIFCTPENINDGETCTDITTAP